MTPEPPVTTSLEYLPSLLQLFVQLGYYITVWSCPSRDFGAQKCYQQPPLPRGLQYTLHNLCCRELEFMPHALLSPGAPHGRRTPCIFNSNGYFYPLRLMGFITQYSIWFVPLLLVNVFFPGKEACLVRNHSSLKSLGGGYFSGSICHINSEGSATIVLLNTILLFWRS